MISTRLCIPMGRPFRGTFKASLNEWSTGQNISSESDASLYNALNTPWQPFALCIPKAPTSAVSQEVLEELAGLAKGTTIMGKPQRLWPMPKHGYIADHFIGAEAPWPPRAASSDLQNIAPDSPESPLYESDENRAPVIAGPKPRAAFEVRAYAATLPEVLLTPLSATFDHAAGSEENDAPVSSFIVDESDDDENSPAIPEPHLRGKREPFGVLHFDEAASPSSKRIEDVEAQKPASPVLSDAGSEASVEGAKGWTRLRAKAPPPIKTNLFGAMVESSKAVTGKRYFDDGSGLSPNRASLLVILNEGC